MWFTINHTISIMSYPAQHSSRVCEFSLSLFYVQVVPVALALPRDLSKVWEIALLQMKPRVIWNTIMMSCSMYVSHHPKIPAHPHHPDHPKKVVKPTRQVSNKRRLHFSFFVVYETHTIYVWRRKKECHPKQYSSILFVNKNKMKKKGWKIIPPTQIVACIIVW